MIYPDLNQAEKVAFERDGYIIRKALFSEQEVAALNDVVTHDPTIAASIYGLADTDGATTELALWHDLGDDIFAAVARSRRMAKTLEDLMGGEMAFFHSKLTLKRPKLGGAWEWHQDYGYWYRNGYLRPDMASVFVALDPSKRENGCLRVLKGSHKLGRIEHGVSAGQVGADMVRVEAAMAVMEEVYVEMDPGDALFFHGNTLHASGQNISENTRNVLLCCYNRADNAPFLDRPNNGHTKIDILPDAAVMSYAGKPLDAQRKFDKAMVSS